ncbi:SGNH/GDSL hydrolase family protein [Nocardioides gilvus]|uniref:SGNH/GDSL hydrolase family protein n=1 Tax=Nocardioides gilvus TaxID=1735589 RepID=UPI000D740289|nr:SGNH/GDSL hydrolase family protein [Nocardioides gilvus]
MRRTISRASLVVLSLVASALIAPASTAAAPPHEPIWDKGAGGERYVAFGDSFVSGPGIAPQRPGPCVRSEKNFPTLVAEEFKVTSYIDASCGGAETKHLTEAQTSLGGNAPQLDALSADTTLVTFGTLGGNDLGLVQLAVGCATTDCVPPAGTDPNAGRLEAVRQAMTAGLAAARKRAPRAEIYVIGYGTYLPEGGCPAAFGNALTPEEFDYVQGEIDRLSDVLEQVAAAQGVGFIDQREVPGAAEHTACAPPQEQWIRAFETYGDGVPLHPSTAGMVAIADHVVASIRAAREAATPQPTPKPTRAERLKKLRAKARTAQFTATCHRGGRILKPRVTRGGGAITKVVFKVGRKTVGVDRTAPWAVKVNAAKIRKSKGKQYRGKVHAVITFRDGSLSIKRSRTKARPSCLKAAPVGVVWK